MIPQNFLPMVLPGEVETELMQDVINDILSNLVEEADEALPDGIFPGAVKLNPDQRLLKLLDQTDIQDLPLLLDPNYLANFKAGLASAPVSPLWQNALSVPDTFKELRREFLSLLQQKGIA